MDVNGYNSNVDKVLLERGVVDLALFLEFETVYGYKAENTVNWVAAKLGLLKSRLNQGKSIVVYEPKTNIEITIDNLNEFNEWERKYFPVA